MIEASRESFFPLLVGSAIVLPVIAKRVAWLTACCSEDRRVVHVREVEGRRDEDHQDDASESHLDDHAASLAARSCCSVTHHSVG